MLGATDRRDRRASRLGRIGYARGSHRDGRRPGDGRWRGVNTGGGEVAYPAHRPCHRLVRVALHRGGKLLLLVRTQVGRARGDGNGNSRRAVRAGYDKRSEQRSSMGRSRETRWRRFEEPCHGNRNRRARIGSGRHRRTVEVLRIANDKRVADGEHTGQIDGDGAGQVPVIDDDIRALRFVLVGTDVDPLACGRARIHGAVRIKTPGELSRKENRPSMCRYKSWFSRSTDCCPTSNQPWFDPDRVPSASHPARPAEHRSCCR